MLSLDLDRCGTVVVHAASEIRIKIPMTKRPGEMPSDLFPTEDEIVARARELCLQRRSRPTDVRACLKAAEQDLLERGARKALRAVSSWLRR
jgi:hypothetical protein